MFKFTKIISLVAVLGLQVGLASAQELEMGTGAQGSDDSPAVMSITQNEDGTFGSDQEGVDIEFTPTETEEPATIADAENITTPTEEESMFSLRRITKWGGVISGVLFILVVLMQEKGVGLSSTFGGSGGFYASKRGAEKVLFSFTIILAIAFVVLNVLAMTL